MAEDHYNSPRFTYELPDCSMPMTFDQYSHCSFDCLYCFSYFQKSINSGTVGDYHDSNVKKINMRRLMKMFLGAESDFLPLIRDRITMQWGSLADPFDYHEKRYGLGLEILKFFKQIDYPLSISTKGTWFLHDKRYRDIIRGQKNWHFKISIINMDRESAFKMERFVASPKSRLRAIGHLVNLGVGGVTLRLRPFIIGHSDKNDDYLSLISRAAQMGADSVSTEFFCLDRRAHDGLLARYSAISEIIGFDVVQFQVINSPKMSGLLRLHREIKEPYTKKMVECCEQNGMRFYSSDAHTKYYCHHGSCCGIPMDFKYSKGQFTEALMIAKRSGKVRFSDISGHMDFCKKIKAPSVFNMPGSGAARKNQTVFNYLRSIWNDPKSGRGIFRYFSGILWPIGTDANNDLIYEYRGGK